LANGHVFVLIMCFDVSMMTLASATTL